MIIKRNFSPIKVWQYTKYQILFVIFCSSFVWLSFHLSGKKEIALNFTPVGVIGSALAIFVAFRNNTAYSFLIIPLSILIAGIFIIMERTGAANENPFENSITDVPISSICNTIERNLKEMLGEKNLPEVLEPKNGYLF